MVDNPYKTGDPVGDLAQGRPMVVLDAPAETVREWSDRENYDLTDNYANAKLGARDDEAVVRCAYISDIRSEPSKDYTFPTSRVALIDAHHADDGRRLYDRVAVEILENLMVGAEMDNGDISKGDIAQLATYTVSQSLISEASELADLEQTIPAKETDDE